MIRFRLDSRSGLPVYRQIVDQVRQAVHMGLLEEGDRLPAVREVCTQIAVNPNTVHRAYRELEYLGLAVGRVGQGTFVAQVPSAPDGKLRSEVLEAVRRWVEMASSAGMDAEGIRALVESAIREKEEGRST